LPFIHGATLRRYATPTTDLALTGETISLLSNVPALRKGLQRAADLFAKVHSFEDLELYFLRGAGLSPCTYRSYIGAVKDFYTWSGGLHPFQVQAAHIDKWYDAMVRRGLGANSARVRLFGLRRFFANIEKAAPFVESPFRNMDKALVKKLNQGKPSSGKHGRTLSVDETSALLAWLREDRSPRGLRDHSVALFLVTSGLRGAEAVGLHWRDIAIGPEGVYAAFIGKGGKPAEQELLPEVVEVLREAFRAVMHREPRDGDALWYGVREGRAAEPICYSGLLSIVKEIATRARKAGVLTRDLQLTPHTFRRSYATALYKAGMKVADIAHKTRHASVDVLVDHYLDTDEKAAPFLRSTFGAEMITRNISAGAQS